MKIKNRLLTLALVFTTLFSLNSCGVDRWLEYADETGFDQWIGQVMNEHYLWYKDMPSEKNLNYFLPPIAFFNSVLSKEDNKESHIDSIYQEPLPSYGFDYTLYRVYKNDTAFNALVTYVLPQSAADQAGLQRGDWIMQINDTVITAKSEYNLFNSGLALNLKLGKYSVEVDPETEKEVGIVVEERTTKLGAKSIVEDSPVHYSTVITATNGTKVGYIVYSHFTAGTITDPERYNNQLRQISKDFATKGVTQLILDLRYNSGGSLACAQLLNTLIAPTYMLGHPMGNLAFNDKQASKDSTFLFDPQLIQTGSNMDITQGVILSSSATGGVTGVMLNLLLPLERWALVGSSITCSGVATRQFNSPLGDWALHPVVSTVYNSNKESGRGGSFTTAQSVSETSDLTKYLPFGNKDEILLSTALGLLDGTVNTLQTNSTNELKPIKEIINTPSRKAKAKTSL